MTEQLATDAFVKWNKNQEMDMREILGGMEELASMIGIRSNHYFEIISIESPCGDIRELCNPPQTHHKKDLHTSKAQVIHIRK